MTRAKQIWGLTGGIGSGKSTVARVLVERGATLVDADAQAKAITAPGGLAIAALVETWGPSVLDAQGAMDRDAMRQRVFQNPEEKKRLEAILHPLIGQSTQAAIDAACTEWVICDVPLLVESPRWRPRLSGVWVVDCSETTQLARVRQRNQWPDETIQRIIAQQASRLQRLRSADLVTFNESLSLDALSRLVGAQAELIGLR